jgi:hypothetical protein
MTKKRDQPKRALKYQMSTSSGFSGFSGLSHFGLDLIKEMSDILSAEIQAEIDRELLDTLRVTMLQEQGWIAIPCHLSKEARDACLGDHCKGPYHAANNVVVFKNLDDAVWFEMIQD